MKKMKKNKLLYTLKAYDNKPGWKTDESGNIVAKDGNPVYIDSSGNEMTLQQDSISRLNAEAKANRESKQEAENRLKAYGDLDPIKAKEALEKLSKLDQKQLIDSGEVDRLKEEIKNTYANEFKTLEENYNKLKSDYNNDKINSIFANSTFVRDSIAVPLDMFQASFKSNFKIDDNGQISAFDKAGNKIMSKSKIGEYASPEEALQILVESHPQKDIIIKANSNSGTGSDGSGGSSSSFGKKTINVKEFNELSPVQRNELALKAAKGEIQIVD